MPRAAALAPARVVKYGTLCNSAARRSERLSARACAPSVVLMTKLDVAVLDSIDDMRTAFKHLVDLVAGDPDAG